MSCQYFRVFTKDIHEPNIKYQEDNRPDKNIHLVENDVKEKITGKFVETLALI